MIGCNHGRVSVSRSAVLRGPRVVAGETIGMGRITTGKIGRGQLAKLFDVLKRTHRTIGPKLEGGVVVLAEISVGDIPSGWVDRQSPGVYRAADEKEDRIFSFSVGPDSLKKFLYPSMQEVVRFRKSKKGIVAAREAKREKPLAFIGIRPCDLAALMLLDKVFLEGPVAEPGYAQRRRDAVFLVVNCSQPGGNCFCHSMGAGPEAVKGFDVAITELRDSFLLEARTIAGEEIVSGVPCSTAGDEDLLEKDAGTQRCRDLMARSVRTDDLPGLLYRNLDHERWEEIARIDLECGNCTMVCPTCFCSTSYDLIPAGAISRGFAEFEGVRMRTWDSCFSRNFARVHGGNFRPSRRARYRHWMTHKFAYWIDQFGSPGCVGCGRCITWCPVGIDIARELEEFRHVR